MDIKKREFISIELNKYLKEHIKTIENSEDYEEIRFAKECLANQFMATLIFARHPTPPWEE